MVTFQGEPLSVERAEDLAARGWQPIETSIYEPMPDKPGHLLFKGNRTVGDVVRDLRALLGEFPEGAEEYCHLFDHYTCYTPGCGRHAKYTAYERVDQWSNTKRLREYGHGINGDGPCEMPACKCTGHVDAAARQWPEGRIVVFPVRGSSEGYYTHLSVIRSDDQTEDLLVLAKTLREGKEGRDAAWRFARRVADLLGV